MAPETLAAHRPLPASVVYSSQGNSVYHALQTSVELTFLF